MKYLLATALLIIALAAPALIQGHRMDSLPKHISFSQNGFSLHYTSVDSSSTFICKGPISAFRFAKDLLSLLSSAIPPLDELQPIGRRSSLSYPAPTASAHITTATEGIFQGHVRITVAYTYRKPGSSANHAAIFQVTLTMSGHAEKPGVERRTELLRAGLTR